jgi:hypothetical protein
MRTRSTWTLMWVTSWLLILPISLAWSYSPTVPPKSNLPKTTVDAGCYTTTTDPVDNPTVAQAIHIHVSTDIPVKRSLLISQIWGSGGFPMQVLAASSIAQTGTTTPANVASGLYALLRTGVNFGSEQRMTINLFSSPPDTPVVSVNSIVYEWKPKVSNGRLFVIHDGHSDDSYNPDGTVKVNPDGSLARGIYNTSNYVTVKSLLSKGFTVLWLQMPLYGDNLTSSTGVTFPTDCPNTDGSNNVFTLGQCLQRHKGIFDTFSNPFKFFVEPVVVALNTVLSQGTFTDVTMMGASGGGWSTVVAAAVDPRIRTSVSVAGSLPLFFPSATDTTCTYSRDAEQMNGPGQLYQGISYLDLYILAGNGIQPSGAQRQHIQINNQFDTCCFYGIDFLGYAGYLTAYMTDNALGNYRYILDSDFVGHGYDLDPGGTVNHTLNIALHIPEVLQAVDEELQ